MDHDRPGSLPVVAERVRLQSSRRFFAVGQFLWLDPNHAADGTDAVLDTGGALDDFNSARGKRIDLRSVFATPLLPLLHALPLIHI